MKAFVLPTIFTAVDRFTSPANKINKQLSKIHANAKQIAATAAIASAAILAPLIVAANSAIEFEDRMADVAKTTQLAGKQLTGLGDDILNLAMTTRTPIEGLQKIAEIGGQMGVKGRENIIAFTDSVNKFNVALGSDFQGGVEEASRSIGGLNKLFKETRQLRIDESITKAGSAINALSAEEVVVPELTEFTKRIGALPDAIKPSIQDTMALGAVFNKVGITAEIASRGLGDILMTASKDKFLPNFARQMKLSESAIKDLLNTNPTQFLKELAKSFKGMDAVATGNALQKLGIGDVGAIKTIGALSSSLETLNQFQKISNEEFIKATSLLMEYATKNDTTAAKLAKAQNNFKVLSIQLGTELLPVIGDLLKMVTPVIKSFVGWVRENKTLVKYIMIFAGVLGGLLAILSVVATIVAAVTAPFVLIGLAIAAAIALVAAMIIYWNKWGAALSLFMGPLGLVISLFVSFKNNWDRIVKAFKTEGILAGLKAIGATILDALIYPIQQLLELVAEFTGADWASKAADSIKKFRSETMGVTIEGEEQKQIEPANPQQERQQQMFENFNNVQNNNQININNQNGVTSKVSSNNPIPILVRSTHTYGM